jgi:hypothetical protein
MAALYSHSSAALLQNITINNTIIATISTIITISTLH